MGVFAHTYALGVDACPVATADVACLPTWTRLLRAVLSSESIEAFALSTLFTYAVPRAEVGARVHPTVLAFPSGRAKALASVAETVARARVRACLDLALGAGEAFTADCDSNGSASIG